MSLVREALQKAEREAAARAAREQGAAGGLHAAGQPYRALRRGLPTPVLVLLVSLPLVAGAVFILWILARGGDAPAPPATTASEQAERQETSVREKEPEAIAADPEAPPAPEPATGSESTGSAKAPSPSIRTGSVAAEVPAPRPPETATAPAPRGAPGARAVTETFVREAVLDGGATRIALGGIAWSEAAPLAYLNGELRGVRETVAGLEIRAIERDRVVLAARDRTIVLTLR